MKRKTLTVLLSMLLLLTFATPAFAQGPGRGGRFVLGDNFDLEAEQTLDGDLVVFGGNVTTKETSVIEGDMVVFGGNIDISGTVDGDIAAFGGNVTLRDTANIDGDIALLGGKIEKADGAKVGGQVESLNHFDIDDDEDEDGNGFPPPPVPAVPDYDFEHDVYTSFDGAFGWLGRVIGDIIWTISVIITLGLISWLVAAFMPEQMMTVRRTLADSTALSFGVGLVTALVFTVVGLLLLITICLAFIPIIGWILLAIAAIFGWIVVGQILGERLLVASGKADPGFISSTLVGVIVLTLLTNMPIVGQIPCIGWLLGFVGMVVGLILTHAGLGAVLLTRFGTRPYPAPGYGYAPSPSPRPSRPAGSAVRWTEPAPDVSTEDRMSSDEELNARIKAALAEADEVAKDAPSPEDKPSQPDTAPEKPNDEPDVKPEA